MDELAWVDFLRRSVKRGRGVLCGIGDDCAVVRLGQEKFLLKSDLFVQDVHFKLGKISLEDIGRRAVCRTLSDFAGMAGKPRFIGVSVGVPAAFASEGLKKILAGILAMAKKYDFALVGGDTGKAPKLVLDVWGLGTAQKPLLRSGAKIGDLIFITGRLGQRPFDRPFEPRLKEAAWLAKHFRVNSAIDISDGFIIDLYRILRASNKGALVQQAAVPVTRGETDLYRGEDYELIFTVDRSEPKLKLIERRFYRVGEIKAKSFGFKVQVQGRLKAARIKGYQHF